MFDDCESNVLVASCAHVSLVVEHAASPPGVAQAASALPSLQYEGFEPSPYAEDDDRAEIEETAQVRIQFYSENQCLSYP